MIDPHGPAPVHNGHLGISEALDRFLKLEEKLLVLVIGPREFLTRFMSDLSHLIQSWPVTELDVLGAGQVEGHLSPYILW